jgi:hypothetical protein
MNDEIRISDALNAINFYAQPYIKFILHLQQVTRWHNPSMSIRMLIIWNCVCLYSGGAVEILSGLGLYFAYFCHKEAEKMPFVQVVSQNTGLPILLAALWKNSGKVNVMLQYAVIWAKAAKVFAESGAWIVVVFGLLFLQQFSVPLLSARNLIWLMGNIVLLRSKPAKKRQEIPVESDEQQIAMTYENQRWWLFIGWTDKMLTGERTGWSDEQGTQHQPKESFNSSNINWIDAEWMLEVERDKKKFLIPESQVTTSIGWQYALNGSNWSDFSPVQVISSAIRRRKWQRKFVLKQ